MKYDYSYICGCGWERYSDTLAAAKKEARQHVNTCTHADNIVYIDRHFKGSDIDDSFPNTKVISDKRANDLNAQVLGNFFSKI